MDPMPAPVLDFWFDFASTYSYPSVMRIGPLAARLKVRFRPFLLGPIFKAQAWATSPFNLYPAKGRYMWRDLERLCADLALPLRRPDPFPQDSLLAARVALVGLDADWGEDFCRGVFRAEFGDGQRIDDPRTLRAVLEQLGIAPEPALAAARSEVIKVRLRTQTEEARQLGVFGAPSFICADRELFWGNDRLEQAVRWANDGRDSWARTHQIRFGKRGSLNVRFAPKATELLRRREITRSAKALNRYAITPLRRSGHSRRLCSSGEYR